MRRFRSISCCLVASLLLAACSNKITSSTGNPTNDKEAAARHKLQHKLLRRLAKMIEGNYNSSEQALADREYRDQRLHIKRIWKNRNEDEGMYFYVEQAASLTPTKPFRQQVYQLHMRAGDEKIELLTYSLRGGQRFTGQWKHKEALLSLTPDSLVLRNGCAMVMYQNNTSTEPGFRGQTEGHLCASDQPGADYMTTDLSVNANELILWERGYSAADAQSWGPRVGGYVFKRETRKSGTPKSSDEPTPTKEKDES